MEHLYDSKEEFSCSEIDLEEIVDSEIKESGGRVNREEKRNIIYILKHLISEGDIQKTKYQKLSDFYSVGKEKLNDVIQSQVKDEMNQNYDTCFGIESPEEKEYSSVE